MGTTTERTEAETVVRILTAGAAWWQKAAEALAAGDLQAAHEYAQLGDLGTDGMRQRIAAL